MIRSSLNVDVVKCHFCFPFSFGHSRTRGECVAHTHVMRAYIHTRARTHTCVQSACTHTWMCTHAYTHARTQCIHTHTFTQRILLFIVLLQYNTTPTQLSGSC